MGGPDGWGPAGSPGLMYLQGSRQKPLGKGGQGSTFLICLLVSVIPRPEGLGTSSHVTLSPPHRRARHPAGRSLLLTSFSAPLAFAVVSREDFETGLGHAIRSAQGSW